MEPSGTGSTDAAVLADFYCRKLGVEGASRLIDFHFATHDPSRADVVKVLRVELPLAGRGAIFFGGTVASLHPEQRTRRHHFVGMFLSDDVALCEMVAAAYHADVHIRPLGYGSSFDLGPRSALRTRGYAGAVVLEPELQPPFADGEEPHLAIPTKLFSVLPLTAEEVVVKTRDGLDALLTRWEAEQKNIFLVRPGPG